MIEAPIKRDLNASGSSEKQTSNKDFGIYDYYYNVSLRDAKFRDITTQWIKANLGDIKITPSNYVGSLKLCVRKGGAKAFKELVMFHPDRELIIYADATDVKEEKTDAAKVEKTDAPQTPAGSPNSDYNACGCSMDDGSTAPKVDTTIKKTDSEKIKITGNVIFGISAAVLFVSIILAATNKA